MQTDDEVNSQLAKVKYPESLKLQLAAFQTHLKEVETVMEVLSKYSPTELDSYKLIEKLLIMKIGQLESQVKRLERDQARPLKSDSYLSKTSVEETKPSEYNSNS
jgi:hypothetical protein